MDYKVEINLKLTVFLSRRLLFLYRASNSGMLLGVLGRLLLIPNDFPMGANQNLEDKKEELIFRLGSDFYKPVAIIN